MLRDGALLAIIAVGGVSLLAGVHLLTRERIAEQRQRAVLERLAQVLPTSAYDNDLLADVISVQDSNALGQPGPTTVYRARRAGRPVAVIMAVTAPDGYNGDIRLLVAILYDGTISGVRVVEHRETPGLGDPIEVQRSDWIRSFRGRSLTDPAPAGWAVRRDGGVFDQFTGATITPRAVVEAVQRALEYYTAHRQELFDSPAVNQP